MSPSIEYSDSNAMILGGPARSAEAGIPDVNVVVAEDPLLGPAAANPGDHRCVIFLIREDHAIRQDAAQRA
jgi:hypothetical protein